MDCPNEKILSSYLDERLPEDERRKIEAHISECNRCLDLLIVSFEADRKVRKCPALLKEKIRKRTGLKEKKKRPELKWLFGALALFTLSFVFKRLFLQFLTASAILGFKWVMEGEAARRVVMIFRGLESKEKDVEEKRIHHK